MVPGPNKTERRRQRLAEERAEALRNALATPRPLSRGMPSGGLRALQVARLPSFELARCFEICAQPGNVVIGEAPVTAERQLSLRLSVGSKPGSKLFIGHELVAAPAEVLASFCDRFSALELSVSCSAPEYSTADGVRIHVAIASAQAEATFRWVEGDVPRGWLELDDLARTFLHECELLVASS